MSWPQFTRWQPCAPISSIVVSSIIATVERVMLAEYSDGHGA